MADDPGTSSQGATMWAPCDHCLAPEQLCHAAPDAVWAPVLATMAVQAVLQIGCEASLLPGRRRELIYPLDASSRRRLHDATSSLSEVAGVPVNEVRLHATAQTAHTSQINLVDVLIITASTCHTLRQTAC
jgi:hypothetical protein